MTIITDHDTLEKRRIILEAGGTIDHSQMPINTYLNRLSLNEQQGLVDILNGLSRVSSPYFRKETYLYSIFGVGTITYDENYWEELKKYIGPDDANKQFVENKGEDIDIVICPEQCGRNLIKYDMETQYKNWFNKKNKPTQRRIFYDRKKISKKINKNKNVELTPDEEFIWEEMYDIRTFITAVAITNNWKHTPWSDKAPFGANYYPVPKHLVEKVGSKVVRTKEENCGVENTIITMPDCRPFHIYVNDRMCRAHKIEYERIINLPFAVLFSAYTEYHFREEIAKRNGTFVERPKRKPYDIDAPENREKDLPF